MLEALGGDAMVLPAAVPLVRGRDSELPYRPDAELYYLTGLREPGAVLVLRAFDPDERTVLFVRSRDARAERWTGSRLGPEGALALPGVDSAYPIEELERRLPRLLMGADAVRFRLGAHPAAERAVIAALQRARATGARDGRGPRAVRDPGGILDEMRLRKDPGELRLLRAACEATARGFAAATRAIRPGVGEWEVEAELVAAFRREGANPAFAPIVASGPNACVLHYIDNGRRIAPGDLVLVDAGAEVGLYAGDVTRTMPASGHFSPEQRDVYEIVDAARRDAISAIAPDAEIAEVHRRATSTLVRGLVDLGVLAGDPEELLASRAHEPFFPHQTSHWLGLDTHDPGDYARDGHARRLEPGMVLTVEPGLYFPPPGLLPEASEEAGGASEGASERAARFHGIGIRLEDDVLVTESGAEVLSASVPADPDVVSALVGGSEAPVTG